MKKSPIFSRERFIEDFRLYIFDLDGTLYPEEEYLFAAYDAIAKHIENKTNASAVLVSNFLKRTFNENGRDHLFDRMNAYFQLSIPVEEYLQILRSVTVENPIALFPEMEHILREIQNRKKPVYLATNGNKQQQQNKISSIEWNGLLSSIGIVYCCDVEPKPSPASLLHIIDKEKAELSLTAFVGDSEGDKEAAQNAGITFIHVSNFLSC
jgi:HAD superfamily hydrolase (TIGR01549 family)